MNYILHLDTSAQICTIMLSADGKPVQVKTMHDSKSQSAQINALIDEVLKEAGININVIKAVSVCNGPGSYTGLRVGLSTAKGICYALDLPLILHNKLSLIAADFEHFPNRAVALKARDGEVFGMIFLDNKVHKEATHFFMDDFIQNIEKINNLSIISDDLDLFNDSKYPIYILSENEQFGMENWAKTAFIMYKNEEFADLAYSEPYYLKAAFTTQAKK